MPAEGRGWINYGTATQQSSMSCKQMNNRYILQSDMHTTLLSKKSQKRGRLNIYISVHILYFKMKG